MDDRETKLPQWARDILADLRRKLDRTERTCDEQQLQLDEYASRCGQTHMTLEPYRNNDPTMRGRGRGQVFPIQTHVRIKGRADSKRGMIDVRVTDEGFVEVSATDGQILVLPAGGQNVIKIATQADYENARTRGLQAWEERVASMQASKRKATAST
jgi:hypothetical protein